MNIETTLWFNMKRRKLLKYKLNTVRHCIYCKGWQERECTQMCKYLSFMKTNLAYKCKTYNFVC